MRLQIKKTGEKVDFNWKISKNCPHCLVQFREWIIQRKKRKKKKSKKKKTFKIAEKKEMQLQLITKGLKNLINIAIVQKFKFISSFCQ